MDNSKRKLSNKDNSEAKKQKVITMEVKIKSNTNAIIGEIIDHGTDDLATIQETLDTEPENLSEGELININEQTSREKRIMRFQGK